MRGRGLRNWHFEIMEDIAECGVAIVRSGPRKSWFDAMPKEDTPRADYLKGALITDVWGKERADPKGFSAIEDPQGGLLVAVHQSTRHIGEIAKAHGLEKARAIAGFLDMGTALDNDDPAAWPQHDTKLLLTVAIVEGPTNGGLVVSSGDETKGQVQERVLMDWENHLGRPSFYPRVTSTRPWTSPLDRMVQLTNLRNFYATMLDLQAAGAAFRHWQLIEESTGDVQPLSQFGASAPPEHLIYNMAEPPPQMGIGTKWELAPFEFHDLMPRYIAIREQHDESGFAVARIMGAGIGENTHVGTAHIMEHESRRNFNNVFKAMELGSEAEWADYFGWHRDEYKDQVIVHRVARDVENDIGRFINLALSLTGAEVKSEHVRIDIRPDLPIDQAARYRLGREMRTAGDLTYRTAVENDLVPFVDDAEGERAALYIEQRERLKLEAQLSVAVQQHIALITGQASPQQGPGTEPGRIGSGASAPGKGPDNIADTSVNPTSDDVTSNPTLIAG